MKLLLFVPAHNEKLIKNARQLKKKYKDLTILFDLEDGVSDNEKKVARENFIKYHTPNDWVRIDPHYSIYLFDRFHIDTIVVPKVNTAKDVELYNGKNCHPSFKCVATIETPEGVQNIKKIAKKADGLLLGTADLEWMLKSDNHNMFVSSQVIIAAKAAGIPVYNCPAFSINEIIVELKAYETYYDGYDGLGVLHPDQLPIIKEYCKPDEECVDHAKKILKACEDKHMAILDDGTIVGPPMVRRAKQILGKS